MQKQELREHFRAVRAALSGPVRKALEVELESHLLPFIDDPDYRRWSIYLSFGEEVNTFSLLDHLLQKNKEIWCPKVVDHSTMAQVKVTSTQDLQKGRYGILEPAAQPQDILPTLDVIIIPGLAFTPSGDRLGYGRGYYDRFLATFDGLKVGLAFSEQITPSLPVEAHDVALDQILTPQGPLIPS